MNIESKKITYYYYYIIKWNIMSRFLFLKTFHLTFEAKKVLNSRIIDLRMRKSNSFISGASHLMRNNRSFVEEPTAYV